MRLFTLLPLLLFLTTAQAQQTQLVAFAPASSDASAPKQIDITRFTQDYIDNVGGKLSVGIAFDEGFGVPVRYYWNPKNVVEAGFYVGSTAVVVQDDPNEPEFYLPSGPMFSLGYCRLGAKFEKAKTRKSKIRALGVTPRFQYQFPSGSGNTFSKTYFSVGFTQETYKGPKHNRNYIFEVGPYYRKRSGQFEGLDLTGTDFGVYLRFNWNWFID